jgi:hypothetical protein
MAEVSRTVPNDELLKESFFKYFGKEIAEKSKIEAVMINLSIIGSGIPQDISDAVRQTAEVALDVIVSIISGFRLAHSFDDFRKAAGLVDHSGWPATNRSPREE